MIQQSDVNTIQIATANTWAGCAYMFQLVCYTLLMHNPNITQITEKKKEKNNIYYLISEMLLSFSMRWSSFFLSLSLPCLIRNKLRCNHLHYFPYVLEPVLVGVSERDNHSTIKHTVCEHIQISYTALHYSIVSFRSSVTKKPYFSRWQQKCERQERNMIKADETQTLIKLLDLAKKLSCTDMA